MEAANLLTRLGAYGADESGINDRFMGDAELYEKCFANFLAEANFSELGRALAECDCDVAFDAAHALKGLSDNLGLTPFYEVICVLVESLRAKSLQNVDAEYQAVMDERERLQAVYAGEAAESAARRTPRRAARPKRRINRFLLYVGGGLVLAVSIVIFLFLMLSRNYEQQVDFESAHHLTEICYQIKLYVEERIDSDWKVSYSVANSIARGAHDDPDATLLPYMQKVREIWGVSEIIILTEDGYAIRTDGRVVGNDVALETVYQARARGEYLTIVESELTYTVPVETQKRLNGSRIVAVSTVQDVGSFLDSMEFSAFNGTAYLYLTQANGAVISRLSHADAPSVYNIMALLQGKELVCLTGETNGADDGLLTSELPITHLLDDSAVERYIVSAPIAAHNDTLRLFYVVPERAVNETMDRFSSRLTLLSVLMIAAFSLLALVLFLYISRARKKQFDEALMARERMFDLLTQNSNSAFALFSTQADEPLFMSANAERIVGRKYLMPVKSDAGYSMRNDIRVETDTIRQINAEMRDWDGLSPFKSGYIVNPTSADTRYFSFELYPVNDGGTEYVGIAQEATAQHDHEETVKSALDMAERSNAAKTRFLSNMSHDIRTPLNAIVNMTDFALDSVGKTRQQVKYLQTIRESSEHLLRLVNDVLDMSRIESGQAVISAAAFLLKTELNRLMEIVRPLCEAKRQTLLADFDNLHTDSVLGDRLKISQILLNLLSNAVKFTPERGAIRFSASDMPSPHHNYAAIRFVVEDNGIGISEQDIEHIFDPFMRVDDRRVDSIEGTGLGLSIVKSYVSAMGGKISCESERESGSKFTVELLFERAQAGTDVKNRYQESAALRQEPFRGMRCLLCEDNETNLLIARTLLDRLGFMTETAVNGSEGADKFLVSRQGYYDVVYMDIRMPVMDGYQAAVAIRSSAHPQAKSIPIVAMTANVFAEDIEKARIAGMNGFLGKPIMVLELVDETNRVLNMEERSE